MKVSDTLPHFIYISFLRCAIIGIDCCWVELPHTQRVLHSWKAN
jgi:hypothetical protein